MYLVYLPWCGWDILNLFDVCINKCDCVYFVKLTLIIDLYKCLYILVNIFMLYKILIF